MLYNTEGSDMAMLTLKIPDEVDKRLKDAAKKAGNSKASLIRTAIVEYLKREAGGDGQ